MNDDFEASLQVLRGFDSDISLEVNEIKVSLLPLVYNAWRRGHEDAFPAIASILTCSFIFHCWSWTLWSISWTMHKSDIKSQFCGLQRSVASTSRRTAIRFADLKLRRYWLPLMVCNSLKGFWYSYAHVSFLHLKMTYLMCASYLSFSPSDRNWVTCSPTASWN